MTSVAKMAPQKDFILFDDPAPSESGNKPLSPPSSSSKQLPGIGSFSKHRSPRQSPNFDHVAAPLPDTLDELGGPRRKRQKSQVYTPSSAALSRSSREGTSGSSGQASNERITPPDPPSGSLGAPMHDLSLGDSMPSRKYDPNAPSPALASPASAGMTAEQQERVKAQIRAELAGVDTRTFKGPLRDILQKQDYTPRPNDMQTSPLSASSDPMQAGVAPSFSLFPDYDRGGQSQTQSSQTANKPPKQETKPDEEMPLLIHRGSSDLHTRSSTFDNGFAPNSYPPARHSQNYLPDWARQSQSSQGSQIAYAQQQSSPRSQHSQQQRPNMPPPAMSQSQLTQRGGPVSMASTEPFGATVDSYTPDARRPLKRESSGLTVSPQEAFLDYDDVENALLHSGLGKMPSLFASVPPGLSDAKAGSSRYSASHSGTNTPRITSQQNAPRPRSSTGDAAYAARPVPMSRNDTARPHHYQQKRPGPSVHQSPPNGRSPYPNQSDGRGSASQESGSQSSLFSPADSGDTISTDDDEDERPYYPPNMRPSMIRGGPSSLYLNYPIKADGSRASTGSPSAMPPRSLLGKERTSSTGSSAWSHVRNEPWAFRQAHMNQPRFSDVSASSTMTHRPSLGQHQSSSESVDDTSDRSSRPYVPSPRANMPGALGAYGYIPSSQESGLSVAPPGAVGSIGGSQDEGSISPSIRSSAQTSDRKQQEIGAPPPLLPAIRQPAPIKPAPPAPSDLPVKDDRVEVSGEEESETGNSASGNGNESDYEDNSPDSHSSKKPASKPKASKPTTSKASTATVAADGTTKCDYVSPITGVSCQTAFHRPYDLARHRETIHAREEAGFIREGKLKLDDCVVLGKEVDPKKSTAVVEWKCKTCGANFSRKDAMLRHERLRHNAAK
ncbi:hypothetical protein NDA16_002733 [Ustilago loliicola]|nr:hypothetical protein NDA16_002733 [Ustilago loliicola]